MVIRPDDIWLAVLVQFNFFVNGNAELLRKNFVSHDGKEKLPLQTVGNRYSIDFGWMSRQMTPLMESKIVDPHLREWIMPTFSTRVTDTILRHNYDGLYEGLLPMDLVSIAALSRSHWKERRKTGKR